MNTLWDKRVGLTYTCVALYERFMDALETKPEQDGRLIEIHSTQAKKAIKNESQEDSSSDEGTTSSSEESSEDENNVPTIFGGYLIVKVHK